MTLQGVLYTGQSNSIGLCVASAVTNFAGFTTLYPAVQFWDKNALNPLTAAPTFVNDGPRDLGPRTKAISNPNLSIGTCGTEISMLRTLDAAMPGRWAGAKITIDGSSLEDQWTNPAFPTGGPAFLGTFVALIGTMFSAMGAALDIVVADQGGTDAGAIPDGADYLVNLRTWRDAIRATHGAHVGFIINRLSSQYVASQGELVRAAQDAFVAETSRSAIIQTTDLALRDVVHFTDNSYVTLGIRQAQARLAMDGAGSITVGNDTAVGTGGLGPIGNGAVLVGDDIAAGRAVVPGTGRFVQIGGRGKVWEVYGKPLLRRG